MNILIPHKWLLEHLNTKATPKKIQECLSLCGPSVERIYDINGDKVYDIEITTNRVDSMSVRGVAREAAVILKQFGIDAKLKNLNLPSVSKPKDSEVLPLPKVVNNPKICKRITAVILKNTQQNPTPKWMAERLEQIETNVHNSVIDITNYITHELGHPCHAFDYDKVMATGGVIIVKEAKEGKKFVTLDGEEYITVGGEIVFENEKGEIIDLPAIKGTANTSIDDNTKNVFLWLETLDAKKVRATSMAHAIRTVAAQLEEKNVDPHLSEIVLLRGIELYQDLTGATVASEIYNYFPGNVQVESIKITAKRIEDYLGIKLTDSKVKQILTDLGCQVEVQKNSKNHSVFIVTPATFRGDMRIPADIIEEIARIYGYHNLPSVVMPTRIPTSYPKDTDFNLENRCKHYLVNIGYQELYSYSMVSEELAIQSGYSLEQHLKLANPLVENNVYLRRSLVPSLIEAIENNKLRKELSVFEFASVYHPQKNELPDEELHLSLVSSKKLREVKSDLESLLGQVYIKASIKQTEEQSAEIICENKKIGEIKIVDKLTVIDIIWNKLLSVAKHHPTYTPVPKTAVIIEDLTFTLKEKTAIGPIIEAIVKVNEYIKQVELKGVYKNNFTFTITYLNPKENISNEDVDPIRRKVVNLVENEFKGKLVGELTSK